MNSLARLIAGTVVAMFLALTVAVAPAAAQGARLDYGHVPFDETAQGQPFYTEDGTGYLEEGSGDTWLPTEPGMVFDPSLHSPWMWQLLPEGLIYRSYLAGPKEPRFSGVLFRDQGGTWYIDSTLGARVGILRFGTPDPYKPEGWQLDVEGAAFPRLNMDENQDLDAADFRAGIPLTYGIGNLEAKFAYYHTSSHLGDEFMIRHPDVERINYVRDALVLGLALRPVPNIRLYGEVGWAFYSDGGALPWEFQFGAEYAPMQATGFRGAPFMAVNGYLREEQNYSGTLTAQVGWMWRSRYNGPMLRTGFQYLNGKSPQFQFFDQFEEQFGWGLWYDF